MRHIAVAGRQPLISLAEIQALYDRNARLAEKSLIIFEADEQNLPAIDRLGGSLKLGRLFEGDFKKLVTAMCDMQPKGKITFGISDYSKNAKLDFVNRKGMELKRNLNKLGRGVRVVASKSPALSSATSHHNQLGEKRGCFEIILFGKDIYLSLGTQNITKYAERDQARPARDAKVGMLPPKLAQTLINLCGNLPRGSRILDPFCGTGVVLQEAAMMGYSPYGSDLNERMVEYTRRNLKWLFEEKNQKRFNLRPEVILSKDQLEEEIVVGDATDFRWQKLIDAVVFEGFLGSPMSSPPVDIKFKTEKANCKQIILGFLKNITPQIESGVPISMAVPAWLREDGHYARLNILDEIKQMGYNFEKFQGLGQSDLLYYREGQVVAREIIVLRKK